jgi:subtilisin-like proprotein convertase family protein
MKHFLFLAWLCALSLLCANNMLAQNVYLMDGSMLGANDCSGRLYDDGLYANYSNSTNETFTITSPTAGCIAFTLDSLNILGNATFNIYDGATTTSTLIAALTTANNSNTARQFLAASGTMTIRFLANAIGAAGAGFVAHWDCAPNCALLSPCATTLYDNGGRDNAYLANSLVTNTFCPNAPNRRIRIDFTGIDIAVGDNLCIYDGNSTAAPSIVCLNNSINSGLAGGTYLAQASVSNTSGCLTMEFTSDATIQGAGYTGRLSCFKPCQTIVPQVLLNTAVPTYPTVVGDSAVNICSGQSLTLSASATYPQNNTNYAQDDATSLYWFNFGDGSPLTAISGTHTATHIYTQGGIYFTKVMVSDPDSLCKSYATNSLRTRVLPPLSYRVYTPTPICLGDTATLRLFDIWGTPNLAINIPTTLHSNSNYFSTPADTIYCIPDYAGGVLSALNVPISINGVLANTITSSSIKYVYINMQHSFVSDLEIRLVCPNNQSVVLKSQTVNGGGATFMGIANDALSTCTESAQGMYYGFLNSATTSAPSFIPRHSLTYECPIGVTIPYTMAFNPTININTAFTIASNIIMQCNPYAPPATNANTLKPGFYLPFNSLDSLNGCPANGQWTLSVTDRQPLDNGMVYEWGMVFDETIADHIDICPINRTDDAWVCDSTTVGLPCTTLRPTMRVVPTQAGDNTYYVHIAVDDFPPCYADIPVHLSVKPLPELHLTNDTICSNMPVVLDPVGGCSNTFNYAYTGNPIVIDNDFGTPVLPTNVNVFVPIDCNYKVKNIQLNGLSHDFPPDIDMWLTAPNGQAVMLMSDVGGTSSITNRNYTIQMGAAPFPATTTSASGTYAPTNNGATDIGVPATTTNLNGFTGNLSGTWVLRIVDGFTGGDYGSLTSWAITFDNGSGNTYTWSTGQHNGSILIAPNTTTTYTVTVVSALGCSNSASATITIDPNAIDLIISATLDTAATQVGTAHVLTYCNTTVPLTYLWSNGSTTATITGLSAGIYTVTATTASGVTFTASVTVAMYIGTKNTKGKVSDFVLYPNPTNGNITLNAAFDTPTIGDISIKNAVGQVMLTQKTTISTILNHTMDLSDYPSGIYFLTLSTPDGLCTKKVVLTR